MQSQAAKLDAPIASGLSNWPILGPLLAGRGTTRSKAAASSALAGPTRRQLLDAGIDLQSAGRGRAFDVSMPPHLLDQR